jgi:cation diffusion facilitator CzcD-associated flavoprotein CzcO
MSQTDHVLIIGTGFAGLGMAIRLKQAGFDDFTILEQAPSLGGTWRDNHYPGAACDVPSPLYSFSFELNPRWSRLFAPQKEILDYLEHCADKYDVRKHIQFSCGVKRAAFDEKTGLWEVQTSDGKTRRARAIVAGCGGLSKPSLPDIAGLAKFKGKVFHTARWDHSYDLAGKRVAVIGTGASAIQVVPAIAPKVGSLKLFQRTPPWIIPKPDPSFSPRAQDVFAKVPAVQALTRNFIYWLLEAFALGFVVDPRLMKPRQNQALKYLARAVRDPILREKLTPKYTIGCKRILFTNDYFPAVQRENVELVTDSIAQVSEHGVVTNDGVTREVDVIVLATGFQAAEACAPFEVVGRRGQDLNETWRNGAEAYLGTTVSGFPNFFTIVGPNTGLGHSSMVFMIESQVQYILGALQTMRDKNLQTLDVREGAQTQYNQRLHARLNKTVWSKGGCTSWYQTKSGKNTTLWPGFTFEYRLKTRKFDPRPYEMIEKGTTDARASEGRTVLEQVTGRVVGLAG